MKKIKCDVVVVGAGPGGSMAAKTCAKYGLDTVLVERKETPGKPNSMGCMVDRGIREVIKLDKKFIDFPVHRMVQTSPDGTEISTYEADDLGYVLNRKTFDNEILNLALKEGPEYMNKTRVTGLIREDGKIKGVKAKIDEKEDVEIRSNIVIGADGVESKIGRWAGIYKRLDIRYVIAFPDVLVNNVDMDELETYTYYQLAGYRDIDRIFFAFYSKGDGKESIQALPHMLSYTPPMRELVNALNYLIKSHPFFKKSKIIGIGGGAIPSRPLEKFVTDGVMLVGDAARQTHNPYLNGVLQSMNAGVLAGETAVEAHEEGDFSYNLLSGYEKKWHRYYGERYFLGFYLREFMRYQSTKDWNKIFHLFNENNAVFDDESFKQAFKSPKMLSNIFNELKNEGLEIPDMLSIVSFLKKYYRNFWDTFV